ncbi:hypothetical protein [Streptomyces sp. MST-110588]|uniref:hypothetical protein n=1 Tax=Streptomyces sp. MST-110588 TaxID=2833628 RepID=UPI001F5C2675|nr:hypothetical protein [Streptomyces sp. MST-110588]UNO42982.1 hypothetical protein KGS77_30070 [Streptomyces sp. MST-110588]
MAHQLLRGRSRSVRSGSIDLAFTVASAEGGYRFDVRTEGLWMRARGIHHHDPAAVAACYVINQVSRLAAACSILDHVELEHHANAQMGMPAELTDAGIRVQWASVHLHVRPEDLLDAQARAHRISGARAAHEQQQLRITQYTDFRDLLRDDPTIALAQLLLENPAAVTKETQNVISEIASQVATFAPGAEWVQTSRLLESFFEGLASDAKQFVIDRLCTVLMEFGAKESAERLQSVHQVTERASGGEATTRTGNDATG